MQTINIEAGVLELHRQKECCRRIHAFDFAATRIGAASFDVVNPERQTGCVSLTVEEVVIMLADKKLAVVDRVARAGAVSLSVIETVAGTACPTRRSRLNRTESPETIPSLQRNHRR